VGAFQEGSALEHTRGIAVAVAGCSVWLSLAALADERLTTSTAGTTSSMSR